MSYRIVYGHLAIRFAKEQLRAASGGDWRFHEDCYLLLELAGDNNLSTHHPASGREVGARRWSLAAYGTHTEVMREICHIAASCESGSTRGPDDEHTTPERFIRRVRQVLQNAVAATDALQMGFWVSVTLASAIDSERAKCWVKEADLLSQVTTRIDEGSVHRWTLHPLQSMRHAVHVFLHGQIDEHGACDKASVDGPRFEFEEVLRRHRVLQNRLALAA